MKQIILAASALTLSFSSCTQTIIVHPNEVQGMKPYGQVTTSNTKLNLYANNPDAAFDQQVAAYSQERAGVSTVVSNPQATAAYIPPPRTTAEAVPSELASAGTTTPVIVPSATPTVNPVATSMAQPAQNQNAGTMDYKVKITNGTPNRLFIEAQDAKGNIYPCGFMQPGQSETTKMDQAQAVASPVLIVVRDPDQPDAPELRRYRVATPNASYANRTLHFTVIPKGRYSAAIDDQVYYASESED